MSVAPPMRQHLPPNASVSSSSTAAMAFASRRESIVVHGVVSSSPVNSGVLLLLPKVRSAVGTRGA
eukprot:5795715-Pleurochrysis_carterae.AAC.1